MKYMRRLALLIIIFFVGLFLGTSNDYSNFLFYTPLLILWIMAWDDRRNKRLKKKIRRQHSTIHQNHYYSLYSTEDENLIYRHY